MKCGLLLTSRVRKHRACASFGEFGGVFVELVLVLPIMLLIAGYSLRLVNILQARTIASVLSREVATAMFKNCVDITIQNVTTCTDPTGLCIDPTRTQKAIQGCLNQIATRINAQWIALMPANTASTLGLTLQVYRYNIGTLAIDTACTSATADTTIISPSPTSISTGLPPGISDKTTMCQRNRVVRAQISFSIKPLTPALPGVSSANIRITDETVM